MTLARTSGFDLAAEVVAGLSHDRDSHIAMRTVGLHLQARVQPAKGKRLGASTRIASRLSEMFAGFLDE